MGAVTGPVKIGVVFVDLYTLADLFFKNRG